jgi:hypothetical protein
MHTKCYAPDYSYLVSRHVDYRCACEQVTVTDTWRVKNLCFGCNTDIQIFLITLSA